MPACSYAWSINRAARTQSCTPIGGGAPRCQWSSASRTAMKYGAVGILGTVEVGNGFPRNGTDGEWKIAGQRGAPPPISVHDWVEAARLIDEAYECAGRA